MKPILAIIGCAILAAASAAVAHTEVRPPILGAAALDDLVLDARNAADPSPFGPERIFVPPTTVLLL